MEPKCIEPKVTFIDENKPNNMRTKDVDETVKQVFLKIQITLMTGQDFCISSVKIFILLTLFIVILSLFKYLNLHCFDFL